jgi:hypothetical protein
VRSGADGAQSGLFDPPRHSVAIMAIQRQRFLTPRWQQLLRSRPSAPRSRRRFRGFLFVEAASFYIAALVHHGVLVTGHEHAQAHAAEMVIGSVLLAGVIASWIAPEHARGIGFAAQAFAFFLTILDLLLIAIGFGTRGIPDLVFNATVLLLLSLGLFVASRAP